MYPAHQRGVLISGPVDYLYVYIYSWECYGEHGHYWDYTNVSSSVKRCPDFKAC